MSLSRHTTAVSVCLALIIAGFTGRTWAGLLAPAHTPTAIIKRVSDEVSRIVRLDDVKARLERMGTLPAGTTADQFARARGRKA